MTARKIQEKVRGTAENISVDTIKKTQIVMVAILTIQVPVML
jgi:hypothetical protein